MKKFFTYLGMISLFLFSLIISEKTTTVVKNVDEIMTEIKSNQEKLNVNYIDAYIKENTIIPGLYGKKINIEKSYEKMKKIGIYNEKYIVYDEIKPEKSIEKEYDKYIVSGNPTKNTISLIFLVKENDKIDNIIRILDENNVEATFFIDGLWLEENQESIKELIDKGHTIGNSSYNFDYNNTGFIWINNILKKIGKQKQNYCYKPKDISVCALQKNYAIKPNIEVEENPLTEIKKQIKPGSLIALSINEKTNNELELVINYLNSRGYKIKNLAKHLSEKNNN